MIIYDLFFKKKRIFAKRIYTISYNSLEINIL